MLLLPFFRLIHPPLFTIIHPLFLAYFFGSGGSRSIMKDGATPVQTMPAPPAGMPAAPAGVPAMPAAPVAPPAK